MDRSGVGRRTLGLGGSLLALFFVTTFSGCNEDPWHSRECRIADDQKAAFMARVGDFPIATYIDSTFSARERAGVLAAIAEWNAKGQQLIDSDFFTVAGGSDFEAHRPDLANCGENLGLGSSALIIQNETSAVAWDSAANRKAGSSSAVGVTLRCIVGNQVQRQVTVLNNSGSLRIDPTQLSSVILHELGHGLGLDHSCNTGASSADYRACQGIPLGHAYHIAVMFPTLQMKSSGTAWIETKDHVQSNDIDRLVCLYGPK